jgi:uncharacterized protein
MRTVAECVNAWSVALASGDRETMNELLHTDYRLYEPDGMPYPGTFEGPQGWWDFWDIFLATWTDISVSGQKLFFGDAGDECTIFMKLSGKSVATGQEFSTSLIELWRFKEGQILEMHPYYYDTRYLSAVAGVI